MYLLTSNTESCDEDDGEVGEGVVEEELAGRPRTTSDAYFEKLHFLMRCGF